MKFCGPSIQNEISKQKQKCSYLFVQIKWEEALRLRKCDQFSLFQSPRPAQRFLNFHVLKKSQFCVFVSAVVMSLVKNLVFYRCHFSFTTFTILERSTYNGQEER